MIFSRINKKVSARIARLKKLERKLAKSRRMEDIMATAGVRNPGVRSVLDVGAARGGFGSLARTTYAEAELLPFEPQAFHREKLEVFCRDDKKASWIAAAAGRAGRERGTIFFDETDPFGGQASNTAYESNNIEVPVTTIDLEVAEWGLPGPYLIKLDTHGFEVPILDGAIETLKETDVLIVECYNWRLAPECVLFDEMCAWLRERGFRCADAATPHLLSGSENQFWIDLVFVRDESFVREGA